jgi:hypothetical protein
MNKTKITIIIYFIWFVVNFICTIIPIIFTRFLPNVSSAHLFSSFLIFIYTLLILSAYVFYSHLRTEAISLTYADVFFWITVPVIIVICITFPFYNLESTFSQFLNTHIYYIAIITFLVGFILALQLHRPILQKQIEDLYYRKVWENADQIRKDVGEMERKIQGEESQ